jgi:hypothetical protein
MEKHKISYGGKDYEVIEPTIELWGKLASLQDWTDETEFAIILISHMTGLSKEDIQKSNWHDVLTVSQNISNHLLHESKQFHKEFEFEGQKYKFIDLPNLTFGEFIDIDTYLSKPEMERRREMHLLMALLYKEDGGEVSDTMLRAERFKKLPVKYVNGASSFFLRIEKILQGSSPLSFWTNLKMRTKAILILGKILVSVSIGLGLGHLSLWRMKILQRWTK